MKEALSGSTWLAGQPVEIWFQDEARVGQKGGHAYIWAEKGSRPLMVRDNRHDSAYLLGAICPARAVGAAIIMPTVNAEAMNEHLKEISVQVATGAHAALRRGAGEPFAAGHVRFGEREPPVPARARVPPKGQQRVPQLSEPQRDLLDRAAFHDRGSFFANTTTNPPRS